MTDTNKLEEPIEEVVQGKTNRILHQSDFIPKIVKQRAIEANIVFTGTAANRPDGSTAVQVWFANDTNVLSIWNGTAWKSTTLS